MLHPEYCPNCGEDLVSAGDGVTGYRGRCWNCGLAYTASTDAETGAVTDMRFHELGGGTIPAGVPPRLIEWPPEPGTGASPPTDQPGYEVVDDGEDRIQGTDLASEEGEGS